MFNELKEIVESLQEDEAKVLLFQFLLNIKRLEDEKYPEEQFTKDLQQAYKDIIHYAANKNKREKDYETVHIVFDDSISGSLKMALSDMGLRDKEKVNLLIRHVFYWSYLEIE